MRKLTSLLLLTLFGLNTQATVDVMFHPRDPSLSQIADHIMNAEKSVDMALYNIETSNRNPVMKALRSDEIQKRIQSGDLNVRIIFEGFGSKTDNQKRMQKLEDLGVDARHLGVSKKMHHKFATIDTQNSHPVLITGSANWSLSSKNHYNENILFFQNHPGLTQTFQNEFEDLWANSKEFGFSKDYSVYDRSVLEMEHVEAFFNTAHFDVENGFRRIGGHKFTLTRELIKSIENASHSINIATTRIKLRPVYEALLAAAARGVQINAVVTMGEYKPFFIRNKKALKDCEHIFEKNAQRVKTLPSFWKEKTMKEKRT